MMLESLAIKYEVLEASDHVGGRLFTKKFSNTPYDYYDVGAMRFPDTPMMARAFKLFEQLKLPKDKYFFENDNSTLLYNNILQPRRSASSYPKPWDIKIPESFDNLTWNALVDNAIKPFAKKIAQDFKNNTNTGWKFMMQYDQYSTRAYMSGNREDTKSELDRLNMMPYPISVVNWLETFDKSTGSFDKALSEAVLDSLAFAFPVKDIKWYCIDGGSQVITDTMKSQLKYQPTVKASVTAISLVEDPDPWKTTVRLSFPKGQSKPYAHVINTSTLPCLRAMDLSRAGLDVDQSTALRELTCGPATKIGVKFTDAWWQDPKIMKKYGPIVGGQSFTDRMVRTVVYPSYGVNTDTPSAVLIVSYAWTNDSLRWGSLFGASTSDQLKEIVCRDLAAMHGFEPVEGVACLKSKWVECSPFSWTNNPYSMGAYGFFGPGQFTQVWENLTRPAAKDRLHFGGEMVSARHAWVVGALDASWRAVREILLLSRPKLLDKFEKLWGPDEDCNDTIMLRQIAMSHYLQRQKPKQSA
ncbi:amine oxidase [Laetiporus sulphureus 93-53]|uniref:Amine oxidase n=1 Tax=Laetiporus sulphureus 93-53 TaxID=1314785 RepID=A0A165GHQ8_9APHY|nr:amine oxidase [Laetiporus sulphureus 93-53]KZT10365.1 amine oxidase [Laetiporus sulphureus 93-53]